MMLAMEYAGEWRALQNARRPSESRNRSADFANLFRNVALALAQEIWRQEPDVARLVDAEINESFARAVDALLS